MPRLAPATSSAESHPARRLGEAQLQYRRGRGDVPMSPYEANPEFKRMRLFENVSANREILHFLERFNFPLMLGI